MGDREDCIEGARNKKLTNVKYENERWSLTKRDRKGETRSRKIGGNRKTMIVT